jgi:hypothetical protein
MVIKFKPKQSKGIFETSAIGDNRMLLVDGCIPASALPAILQILDKAGVTLGEMIPE